MTRRRGHSEIRDAHHTSIVAAAHVHNHGAGNPPAGRGGQSRRRLTFVLVLVVLYMLAEVIGGLLSGSLALLADAGHMLSDAGALGLSLFAMYVSQRNPTAQHTYGYYRAEILAALLNGAALVAITLYIFVEAARRIGSPPEVEGGLMMGVAVGGLVVNLVALFILNPGRRENLNVRGAWLHVLSDALGSVGAIVAGILIWMRGWYWADPVVSWLIGLLILYSSWALLRDAVAVLMEGAPGHIDVDEVREFIGRINGVRGVHDLHVWTIASGLIALSAHVEAKGRPHTRLLTEIQNLLHERFGIDHVTIQVEPEDFQERDLPV